MRRSLRWNPASGFLPADAERWESGAKEGEKQLLLVKEWSVYDSLCGFEKFALDNDLFLDAETTTERIRQIWEESSKRTM